MNTLGRIIAVFGRHYEVRLEDSDISQAQQRIVHCYPRGKKSQFACGDQVSVTLSSDTQGVIQKPLPRQNLLWRSDAFREKLIAANLDLIVLVTATEPAFSPLFISSGLAAAAHQQIEVLLILNKIDLQDKAQYARQQLQGFQYIGYQTLELSATCDDLSALRQILTHRRSIMIGQSGMGKTTLLNGLLPELNATTAPISTALDSGRHTTTFAREYCLPHGGALIDSPGMQCFGLAHIAPEELAECFIEFRPFLSQCRFRNCAHQQEPGCALNAAVDAQQISAERLAHYRQIRRDIEKAQQQARGW